MSFKRFKEEIDRGMLGQNEGLPIGMDRLLQVVPNLQKKTFYLVGANTGEGKTTLVDDLFFYTPLEYIANLKENPNNIEVEVLYYSFEIDKISKIGKAINRKIFIDTGKILDVNTIFSRGKNRLSQEDYDIVMSYAKYWEFFEKHVTFFDARCNPTQVYKDMKSMAEKNGKIYKKKIGSGVDQREIFDYYEPHNPNKYMIIYVDHLALSTEERGFTKKQTMEKLSEYLMIGRNNYGMTAVVIQQLNMEIFSPERVKINRLAPMLSDFGDSRAVSRDAEFVMALFNPMKFGLEKYAGYNISVLRDKFRSLEILKSRNSAGDCRIGLLFEGAGSKFFELPRPVLDNGMQNPEMVKIYNDIIK
jgi:replicative DNA helicase